MDDSPPKSTATATAATAPALKPVSQSRRSRRSDIVWLWGRERGFKQSNRRYTLLEVRSGGEVLLQAHLDPPVAGTSKHGGDKRLLTGPLSFDDALVLKTEIADSLLSFSTDFMNGLSLPGICTFRQIEAALNSNCEWFGESCRFFLMDKPGALAVAVASAGAIQSRPRVKDKGSPTKSCA